MSLDVTSHFRSKMENTNPTSLVSVFTFANSLFSDRVVSYGPISRDATEIVGGTMQVTLSNADQLFNDFYVDKTAFLRAGDFAFGFSTESATNDTEQLFGGVLTDLKYRESKLTLTLQDRLARLIDKKVGSDESPVSFVNTNVSAADLGFWLASSFGGLSGVQSTSNPDIDYASFLAWKGIIDGDSTVVNAHFTGQDVIESLEVLQKLTDSTIYAEGDNKVYFNKWSGAASLDTITVTDSHIVGRVDLQVQGTTIVNKVDVLLGYDVNSDTWAGQISKQNTASVNTFGEQQFVFDNTTIWYPNSVTAINLAERIVFRRAEPNRIFEVPTPLRYLDAQLGDEVAFTSRVYSINNETFNLLGYEIDIEAKTQMLKLDEGFGRGAGRLRGFVLDDATWGLLDQDYNPLL